MESYNAFPHVELGRAIYELYLSPGSLLEVNVSAETHHRITALVQAGKYTPHMFNEVWGGVVC